MPASHLDATRTSRKPKGPGARFPPSRACSERPSSPAAEIEAVFLSELLRYRAGLVVAGAKPEASLWPALEIEREAQPARAWSKWFTRSLRKSVGIEDRTKVFHSFRHTFKRMARDAGLQEEMHNALTGHAGGGGVGRGYGGGFGLKAMAAEMARIEAPEAVRSLR